VESLDHAGLWTRILPEWEPNRSRPQRNAYHRFTVDRHLLEATANAAALTGRVTRPDLLLLGTLLHDITLNERFDGPRRFEVEGADLARSFAEKGGVDGRRAQLIWDSVALNSTASIGLYKEAEVALCTAGICLDVVGLQYELVPAGDIAAIVGPKSSTNSPPATSCRAHSTGYAAANRLTPPGASGTVLTPAARADNSPAPPTPSRPRVPAP